MLWTQSGHSLLLGAFPPSTGSLPSPQCSFPQSPLQYQKLSLLTLSLYPSSQYHGSLNTNSFVLLTLPECVSLAPLLPSALVLSIHISLNIFTWATGRPASNSSPLQVEKYFLKSFNKQLHTVILFCPDCRQAGQEETAPASSRFCWANPRLLLYKGEMGGRDREGSTGSKGLISIHLKFI